MIRGTVNGEAGFSATIDPKSFRVPSMGEKTGFPEKKEECKDHFSPSITTYHTTKFACQVTLPE
ncbi:hypothetical protein KK120_16260 [Virgibacillus dakarensis]|uniref:hypothetical protein n=1 Tax=Virgibacillus dakarensis TaxID=1917889 RepID=UPI000B4364DF|nr:hypothetical protein [Virgibacillus dakarensis]MBT2217378.1 hypothetical protein [Virgibacillus dakarensis]